VPDDPRTTDIVRLLATWALLHDTADDAWTAAVARGRDVALGDVQEGDAFADGLAAVVADETERLRARLARGHEGSDPAPSTGDVKSALEALRFEVAELRGRIESLQATIDALAARDEG
jgi:uncharacterized small protein (DUF1192 family)